MAGQYAPQLRTLTFDFYRKLWKGAIFAYDLYADFTAGTPSWHMYAKMGGMERMRGYYEGRYRDKRLVETQIELRQKIYRRHGVVAWIGGGQVWGTDKFRWDNTLYSFGCGYRFEFKNRMNIRLDYGWGVGSQTLLGLPLHGLRSLLRACAARTGHIWESPSRGGAFPCGNPAGTIPYIP